MARQRAIVVALTTIPLVGAACAGDDSEDQAQALDPNISEVSDVQLHPSSVVVGDKSGPDRQTYWVSLPVDGLANFYRVVAGMGNDMPFEGPDGTLEWCSGSRTETSPCGWERVWRKPGTSDFLVLQGTEDGAGSPLSVIDDKANTSRTCSNG